MSGTLDRLDPENRRRVAALLAGRARRLAALDQHATRWPRTFAQVTPVYREMRAQMVKEGLVSGDRPLARCTPPGGAEWPYSQ